MPFTLASDYTYSVANTQYLCDEKKRKTFFLHFWVIDPERANISAYTHTHSRELLRIRKMSIIVMIGKGKKLNDDDNERLHAIHSSFFLLMPAKIIIWR